MNIIHTLVSYVPVSSKNIHAVSYFCGGAAVTSLSSNYFSPLGWGAVLGTLALQGIKSVKEQQEKEIEKQRKSQEFCVKMLSWVTECVHYDKNGYSEKARQDMVKLLDAIRSGKVYIREGSDDFRAPFVGVQNAMEHVIAAQKILNTIPTIVGAIHTPMPATPLCTEMKSGQEAQLMDFSIRHDADKLRSVVDRTVSVRRMLEQLGTLLYIAYPKGGLEKRKEGEQQIFLREVKKYEGRLFACELNCHEIDPAKVGATYLFTDENGNAYAFSIRAQQANNPQEQSTWGIWFGEIQHQRVKERTEEIAAYLKQHNGPSLIEKFRSQCLQNVGGR